MPVSGFIENGQRRYGRTTSKVVDKVEDIVMNKSEFLSEEINKINFAVQKRFATTDWTLVRLLSGGLSGAPIYKIKIHNQFYAIKLENPQDSNFDLVRSYKIIESVSEQGISPKVYLTDAAQGIVLMQYIESKPHPSASPATVKQFAKIIRQLHDKSSFEKWKTVIEVVDHFYQKLPLEYKQKNIIKKCMQEIKAMEALLFNADDVRSCHGDLNPSNILFDGKDYFLVDWQAASPQSLYFDLACCANWLYFYREDLCGEFLEAYFGREATGEEKAKYHLMRIFTYVYFGVGFISMSLQTEAPNNILKDTEIENLPPYLSFMQSIGSGKANLMLSDTKQQFGFVLLKAAESLMNQKYWEAIDLLNLNRKCYRV